MKREMALAAALALTLAPFTSPAHAQPAGAGAESRSGSGAESDAGTRAIEDAGSLRWKLNAEASIWYVAPAGKLKMPASPSLGAGDEVELDDLNLDSPKMAPLIEVDLRRGRWGIALSGFAFSTSDRGEVVDQPGRLGDLAFSPGDRLSSSLDFLSASALGSYEFYRYRNDGQTQGGWDMDSRVEALFGGRVYDVEFDIQGPAVREKTDEFFAEPVVGLRWSMEVGEQWSLDLTGTVGLGPWGDRSSWSFDIAPGFQWRPVEHVGVQVGYRLLVQDLQSGDGADEFDWRGSMAGVYFGVVLRF